MFLVMVVSLRVCVFVALVNPAEGKSFSCAVGLKIQGRAISTFHLLEADVWSPREQVRVIAELS